MAAAAAPERQWQLLPGSAAAAAAPVPPSNPCPAGQLLLCGVSRATQAAAGGRPRGWLQVGCAPGGASGGGSSGRQPSRIRVVAARGSSLASPASDGGLSSDDEIGKILHGLLDQLSAAMRVSAEPAFAQVPVPTIFLGGLPSPIPAGMAAGLARPPAFGCSAFCCRVAASFEPHSLQIALALPAPPSPPCAGRPTLNVQAVADQLQRGQLPSDSLPGADREVWRAASGVTGARLAVARAWPSS